MLQEGYRIGALCPGKMQRRAMSCEDPYVRRYLAVHLGWRLMRPELIATSTVRRLWQGDASELRSSEGSNEGVRRDDVGRDIG